MQHHVKTSFLLLGNSKASFGDFNVDFNRGGIDCAQLLEFMDEYDLTAVDLGYRSHINFT